MAAACANVEPKPATANADVVEPVPNPPPRYRRAEVDADIGALAEDEDVGELQIQCTGHEPYVCLLDDGTFECSDRPCVPACDRVGCLGSDVCLACEDGHRCVPAGGSCMTR
jgi:hypothetical protein